METARNLVTMLQNLSDSCLIRLGAMFIQLVNMSGRFGYRTFKMLFLELEILV